MGEAIRRWIGGAVLVGRLRELGEKRGRKTRRRVPTEADLDWIARQMRPGEEADFLGGFGDFEAGMAAGAEGRKQMAGKGKGKKRAKKAAAAAADAVVAAVAARAPKKKKRKGVALTKRRKSSGLKKRKKTGGLMSGGGGKLRAGSVLVDGLSVIGGAVLAIKSNQMIQARPFGIKPAAIGMVLSFATAFAMRKRNKKIARGAVNVGVGFVAGMTIEALQGAPSGGAPSV